MKVTFKKGDFSVTCNCELMAKVEDSFATDFRIKTVEKTTIEKYRRDIRGAERVLVFEEDDGVEFGLLTATIYDKHKDYTIIHILCKTLGAK